MKVESSQGLCVAQTFQSFLMPVTSDQKQAFFFLLHLGLRVRERGNDRRRHGGHRHPSLARQKVLDFQTRMLKTSEHYSSRRMTYEISHLTMTFSPNIQRTCSFSLLNCSRELLQRLDSQTFHSPSSIILSLLAFNCIANKWLSNKSKFSSLTLHVKNEKWPGEFVLGLGQHKVNAFINVSTVIILTQVSCDSNSNLFFYLLQPSLLWSNPIEGFRDKGLENPTGLTDRKGLLTCPSIQYS